jgi:alpha-1,6-mannosyltransferase
MNRLRWAAVTVLGLLASAGCVVVTASLQAAGPRRVLGRWWTVAARVSPWPHEPRGFLQGGLFVMIPVLALVCVWLVGARVVARGGVSTRAVAIASALWTLPVALAPPLLSRDAYAYLAQGATAAAPGSPYRPPSAVLSAGSELLHAVDPLYRHTISPYGPLALRLFSACVALGHGHALGALVWLRVVMVLAVVAAAWCGSRLAPPGRRALTVWLLAANPLTILHLVGGLHLEAVVVALLGLACVLHSRKATGWAVVAVVAAGAIKATALIVLPVLLLTAWRQSGRRGVVAAGGAAAAALTGWALLLRPDPFGWLRALHGTLQVWDPVSLPTQAAIAWANTADGSAPAVLGVARVICVGAGLAGAAYLCLTSRRRPTWSTAGYVLAVLTLTGPALWPWYVLPAVACLVFAGGRSELLLAAALTAGAAMTALPMPVSQMQVVGAAAELTVLVIALAVRWHTRAGEARTGAANLTVP